jgi:hypothetical protein
MVAKSTKKKSKIKKHSRQRGVFSSLTVFAAYVLDLFASGWIVASGDPDTSEIPPFVSVLAIIMALIVISFVLYVGAVLLIDKLH